MKKIVKVCIRVFRPCARCGHEELSEELLRDIESVAVDEKDRVTVEVLYANEQ
jgi:hypothetical protein